MRVFLKKKGVLENSSFTAFKRVLLYEKPDHSDCITVCTHTKPLMGRFIIVNRFLELLAVIKLGPELCLDELDDASRIVQRLSIQGLSGTLLTLGIRFEGEFFWDFSAQF